MPFMAGGRVLLRERAAPSTPPSGQVALYSVDGTALLMKDDAGVVTTIGGGTAISGLSAASALDGSEVFPVVQGGTTKKATASQMNAFAEPLYNVSTADQSISGNADTFITGSRIVLPQTRIKAGTTYRLEILVAKTGAGTAAPAFAIRFGTAGTTADTSRATLTMGAQAATAAQVTLVLYAILRAVGASGQVQGHIGGSIAGFPVLGANSLSATFDTTPANTGIGVSVNPGASAAWTVRGVIASLFNVN